MRNRFGKGLDSLQIGYSQGLVTKEKLDKTLNAYKVAIDKVESKQRDIAKNDHRDVAAKYSEHINIQLARATGQRSMK